MKALKKFWTGLAICFSAIGDLLRGETVIEKLFREVDKHATLMTKAQDNYRRISRLDRKTHPWATSEAEEARAEEIHQRGIYSFHCREIYDLIMGGETTGDRNIDDRILRERDLFSRDLIDQFRGKPIPHPSGATAKA